MPRIYLSPPDVGPEERALLLDAFDSNWIAPLGPHVDAFERELAASAGVRHGAALSSGTAGLHLALLLLGVEASDEVLVADATFVASANVVRYVGAQPVFIDAEPGTWTLDPELVEQALEERARAGKRVRALISVDLYGQCADYDRLRQVCNRYELPIVQDASEALGATYRGSPAGAQGDLAVFSFNGNKIITTSGGGMLVSNDEHAVQHARFLASQAREPAAHYEHRHIGYNYRLSNLLAAVGRAQLRQLSAKVERRRAHFEAYRAALGELPGWHFMPEASYGRATRWLTCATVEPTDIDRDAVIRQLAAAEIEARPVWKPMHMQPVYSGCLHYGGQVGRRLFEKGICLPSGSNLTNAQRDEIIERITRLYTSGSAR